MSKKSKPEWLNDKYKKICTLCKTEFYSKDNRDTCLRCWS